MAEVPKFTPTTSQREALDHVYSVLNQGSPITERQIFELGADVYASYHGDTWKKHRVGGIVFARMENGKEVSLKFNSEEDSHELELGVPDDGAYLLSYTLEPITNSEVRTFHGDKPDDIVLPSDNLRRQLLLAFFNHLTELPEKR